MGQCGSWKADMRFLESSHFFSVLIVFEDLSELLFDWSPLLLAVDTEHFPWAHLLSTPVVTGVSQACFVIFALSPQFMIMA